MTTSPEFSDPAVALASDRASVRLSPWFLSLLMHLILLGAMVFMVFPYTTKSSPLELPTIAGEIVGRIDVPASIRTEDARPVERPSPISANPVAPAPAPRFQARPPSSLAGVHLIATRSAAPEFSLPASSSGAGDLDDIGLEMGGGADAEFFGVGRSARGAGKFVYVVDRSGSMRDTFRIVCGELRKSISGLRRSQKYHVIFFSEGPPLESPARRLVNAVDANRKESFEFFDRVTPAGGTRPETGLARAFELEPDVIYLLTDGLDFPPDIHERLAEWNSKRGTRIFVIGYLDRTGRATLERIAREHNGEFRFVSEDDLP